MGFFLTNNAEENRPCIDLLSGFHYFFRRNVRAEVLHIPAIGCNCDRADKCTEFVLLPDRRPSKKLILHYTQYFPAHNKNLNDSNTKIPVQRGSRRQTVFFSHYFFTANAQEPWQSLETTGGRLAPHYGLYSRRKAIKEKSLVKFVCNAISTRKPTQTTDPEMETVSSKA